MKEFKGRVVAGGTWKGEAIVSHQGLNTLASFQKSALKNAKNVIVSDQNNKDLFGKNITGKALCLPLTIGSSITFLPDLFLNGCTSFNSMIDYDDEPNLVYIGRSALFGCTSFNQYIELPNTLKCIYNNFLYDCTSFNNGGEGETTYSFNMPVSDVTLSASFAPVSSSHSISTNVTGNGSILSITVNGEAATSAMAGDTILIDAKATDEGLYRVQSATILTDGGETVEWTKKAGKYQFTMPDDNVTFKIIFEEIPFYSITKDTYKTNILYTSGVSSNSAKPLLQLNGKAK